VSADSVKKLSTGVIEVTITGDWRSGDPDSEAGLVNDVVGGKAEAYYGEEAARNLMIHAFVNDILDLQKVESGNQPLAFETVDVASLLEQSIQANQAYAAELGVKLQLQGTPPPVTVWADADRLMQVMANLISNAAKFSPRDATVTVRASCNDATVRVEVADRGSGIPPEFQRRVFDRFAQADTSTTRERGGTGLGLSITKAIVERLGGEIGFETHQGAGTTFHFELPVWRGHGIADHRAERPS
jgi:signal transduction histidine kinase